MSASGSYGENDVDIVAVVRFLLVFLPVDNRDELKAASTSSSP